MTRLMRQSTLFASTLRDIPAEADAASHQLLLRGGFIRQLAAGVYTYMPLGRRVLRKLEEIVREEMDRAGAQETLMPALEPAELLQQSGRYRIYGPDLFRLKDRHDREFALGPTHEEVVTTLVKNEISSYRRLPVTLYQIQTKFRDERRPRFGLLRGRELLMKDAYSFDASWEGLDVSYRAMYEAYVRIFERCGLNFRAVEADGGAIGGEGGTHEFMALSAIGEDTIAACTCCNYAANLERAEAGSVRQEEQRVVQGEQMSEKPRQLEKIHTPGVRTIEQLTAFLGVDASAIIKTLIYEADGGLVAVLVRGDHEVNEIKVKNYLGASEDLTLAEPQAIAAAIGVPTGFAGPVGLTGNVRVLADAAVAQMETGIAGANEVDYHLLGVVPGRDFAASECGDFRNACEGEACPRCGEGKLQFHKGIEVGHVFKLGTRYSDVLGARFADEGGRERNYIMGCYGIGISRLLAAIAEQTADEHGIAWPRAIAPYQVHVIPVQRQNAAQMQLAEELAQRLSRLGAEVLLDDRDERAGVKFHDADLIGISVRIVVGKHAEEGKVEYTERVTGVKELLTAEEAVERIEGMRN